MKDIKLLDPLEAVLKALENTTVKTQTEVVSIFDALNRVLADDIACKKPLPAFDNSAMDGYAVKLSDAGKKVEIKATILAGDFPKDIIIKNGMVSKIMTGAFVPPSAEAIVPYEDAQKFDEKFVILPQNLKDSAHIRRKGEEVKEGEIIIKKGELLRPAHIAILASQGITNIKVYKKLKIGVLSTGSEIKEPWEDATEYQIYNSNSSAIFASCLEMNLDVSYLGAIPDDKELFKKTVREFYEYDVIFTSGGVSVGDADFTEEVFCSEGMQKIIHGLALKPGKHAMYGIMKNTTIIGLPGNPLSSIAVFMLFATPILAKMQGRNSFYHTVSLAKNKKTFSFGGKRANLILGTLQDGNFSATDDYEYGSGMLTPIIKSNSFIIAGKGVEEIKKGDEVRVIMPFTFNSNKPNDIYTNPKQQD
ncbi:MAG: molybdopterin molybdotransferase [Campylobacterota bacterium]|nr:molybdopterin molybdotransferase [Campylobacterota bacterium]